MSQCAVPVARLFDSTCRCDDPSAPEVTLRMRKMALLAGIPWRLAVAACVLASTALCGCASLQGRTTAADSPADARSAAVADAQPVPLGDKLGAHLLALVEDYAAGDLERASSYAQSKGLDLREDRVAVQVLAASEQDASSLERRIKSVGGNVQSRFENSIFAAIPLPALVAFAENDTVWRIDAQRRAFSPQTPGDARPQQTWEEDK